MSTVKDSIGKTLRFVVWTVVMLAVMQVCFIAFIDP